MPQKRVDRHRSNGVAQSPNPNGYRPNLVGQLTEGSPLVPRRQLYSNLNNKTISANNTPSVSPCASPTVLKKDLLSKIHSLTNNDKPSRDVGTPVLPAHQIHRHHRNTSTVSQNENLLVTQPSTQSIGLTSEQSYSSVNTENVLPNGPTTRYQPSTPNRETNPLEYSPSINTTNSPSTPSNNQWRHKLNNLKQSFQNVGTPRFHRRPKLLSKNDFVFLTKTRHFFFRVSVNENENSFTSNSPSQYGTTPEATKKSLFHHIIDAMQEDHHMIVVKDRPLSAIKTDLIHAFLSVRFISLSSSICLKIIRFELF